MSSYVGRHARYYDIFYANKPYEAEALFVHQCLQLYSNATPRRLLELACGTASHALALEKFGYEIIATDYSEDMLARARHKAGEMASSIDIRWQDMRMLDIAERPFDALICLFDSIGYVRTNESLLQVLRGVHRHLRQNGLFVFEFWHAPAIIGGYDRVRVGTWSTLKGEVTRISETKLDYSKQLAEVTYTIYELRHDGTYARLREIQYNRYFSVQEMAGWLSSCGLEPLKWFAGLAPDEQITERTWHIVAIAQKRGELCEA